VISAVQGVVLTLIALQICEESFSCLRPDKRKEFLSDYQNLVLEASRLLWLFLSIRLLTVFLAANLVVLMHGLPSEQHRPPECQRAGDSWIA